LPFNDQLSSTNLINGKLVDWQGAGFKDDYEEALKQRYAQYTMFGESKYQTLPELGIQDGIRKTDIRIKDLGLDKIDFKNKNVIDIGCSGGNFLMYASSMGAKRLTGIDWQKVIDLTMEAQAPIVNVTLPAMYDQRSPNPVAQRTRDVSDEGLYGRRSGPAAPQSDSDSSEPSPRNNNEVFNITMNITTPDANSFKKTEDQTLRDLQRKIVRARRRVS
jgi:hypothetical protein